MIHNISDIIEYSGKLLSHEELKTKYNIETNVLQTIQIHKSIPQPLLEIIKNSNLTQVSWSTDIKIKVNKIYKPLNSVKCKDFYWHLFKNKYHIPTCISKWHTNYENINVNIDEIWNRIFYLPFKICTQTKIQSFQYKLIHKVIACNAWLKILE